MSWVLIEKFPFLLKNISQVNEKRNITKLKIEEEMGNYLSVQTTKDICDFVWILVNNCTSTVKGLPRLV